MIFTLAAAVWAHRPRWHRTPALAAVRPVEHPADGTYRVPGEDRVLAALAKRGGDEDHALEMAKEQGAVVVRTYADDDFRGEVTA